MPALATLYEKNDSQAITGFDEAAFLAKASESKRKVIARIESHSRERRKKTFFAKMCKKHEIKHLADHWPTASF